MSALKIGDKEYSGLDNPLQGLMLIRQVVKQYFGPLWTNFNPQCPLCNDALQDFAKNMNRSVGTCPNINCGSEIHPYDYFGKIMDILRMVEQEFGDLEEVSKKKLVLESNTKGGKKKKLGKNKPANGLTEIPEPVDVTNSNKELIFEY